MFVLVTFIVYLIVTRSLFNNTLIQTCQKLLNLE